MHLNSLNVAVRFDAMTSFPAEDAFGQLPVSASNVVEFPQSRNVELTSNKLIVSFDILETFRDGK